MVSDGTERLRAFCSVTLDGAFVIRDLKIIDGSHGPFVAMPSRKLADRCPDCRAKNHLRARFCNECGVKLNENRAPRDPQGRVKLHADVAHPINADCREQIQSAVIEAFEEELELSKKPGYKPRFDFFDDIEHDEYQPVGDDDSKDEFESNGHDVDIVDDNDDEDSNYDDFISNLKATLENRRGGDAEQTVMDAASQSEPASESETSCRVNIESKKDESGKRQPASDDEDGFGAGIF